MNGLANRESSKLARLILVFVLACLALFTKTGNAWASSPAVERVLATEQDAFHRPPIYVGETTRDGQTGSLWHSTVNTEYSALLGLANADLPEGSAAINANQLDAFNDPYVLISCHGMQGYKRIGVFPAVNGDDHYYTNDELVRQHGTCRRSTIDNHDYFVPHAAVLTPDESVQQETVAMLALTHATDANAISTAYDAAEDRVATLAMASPAPFQEHLDAFQTVLREVRHHLRDLAVADTHPKVPTAETPSGAVSGSTSSADASKPPAPTPTPSPTPVPQPSASSSRHPGWGWILITCAIAIAMFFFGWASRGGGSGSALVAVQTSAPADAPSHALLTAWTDALKEFFPVTRVSEGSLRKIFVRAKNDHELLHDIAALFPGLKGPFTSVAPVKALSDQVSTLKSELTTANATIATLRGTIHSANEELQTVQNDRDDYQRKYDALVELTVQERTWSAGLFARWEEATTLISAMLKTDILLATDVALDRARRSHDPGLQRVGEELNMSIASTLAVLARGHDAFILYANQFRGFCESHALDGLPAPTFIPIDFGQPARPFLELFANDTIDIMRFLVTKEPSAPVRQDDVPRSDETTAEFTIPPHVREGGSSRGPISVGLAGGGRVNGRVMTLTPPALGDEATAIIVVPPPDPTITPTESSEASGSGTRRLPSYNPHDPDGQGE